MKARVVSLLLFLGLLSACQSTQENSVAAAPTLLNDSLFSSHHLFPVESIDDIFFLGEDLPKSQKFVLYWLLHLLGF